ncbi:hypothetical protein H4Q26_008240 [Puccinia striiformis f. sp. tritici PST-130]|nr:hypothetical protein H4Q26_008240 [Puccinia striiformis f. sp. tritici PST-130]
MFLVSIIVNNAAIVEGAGTQLVKATRDNLTVQKGLVDSSTGLVPPLSEETPARNKEGVLETSDLPMVQDHEKETRDGGEGRTCMPSFTDILSRVPAVREDDLIVITSNKSATLPTAKSDKERLEDKIMEASAAGDKSSATLFFRLYEQLCSGTMLLKPPMNLADQRSVSSDASLLGQTTKASNSNPVFAMKHKKFENANNGDNSDSGGGRGRGGYGGRGGWHGRNDDQGNDFGEGRVAGMEMIMGGVKRGKQKYQ